MQSESLSRKGTQKDADPIVENATLNMIKSPCLLVFMQAYCSAIGVRQSGMVAIDSLDAHTDANAPERGEYVWRHASQLDLDSCVLAQSPNDRREEDRGSLNGYVDEGVCKVDKCAARESQLAGNGQPSAQPHVCGTGLSAYTPAF